MGGPNGARPVIARRVLRGVGRDVGRLDAGPRAVAGAETQGVQATRRDLGDEGDGTHEAHTDALNPGERVLLVDDVLATGGTLKAAAKLARRPGGHVVGAAVQVVGVDA